MTVNLVLVALIVAGLLASWFDIRERRLPNWLCLAVAFAGLTFATFDGGASALGWQALHATIALVVGMGLFAARIIGGGDAKYYAATAAWFGLSSGLYLLVSVALSGFVVLVVWAIVRRAKGLAVFQRAKNTEAALPYGVAIALGAAFTAWQLGRVPNVLL
jgi:prepilin peptidase CpaA